MKRERRRKPAPLETDRSPLALCVQHAQAAVTNGDSGEAQKAIFYLLSHLGETVADLKIRAGVEQREQWRTAAQFLEGCLGATALDGLASSLTDISQGISDPELRPVNKRGRKQTSWRELSAMRKIVEGADALAEEVENDLVYRLELAKLGAPYGTVGDYRNYLSRAGVNYAPRLFQLTHGNARPAAVVKSGVADLVRARRSLAKRRFRAEK